ncbi:hypothetical protein E2R51_06065 [Jeotgalibacillus sp. S-D1]|uniref:hypothetical protein n=1 Tax=Jeotgalibacillus sp. S-D1 TaxID=2552189 RepID=UPI001059BDB2|nr:hypothetical protein [Jeotgalibacillus sp. S-D1]TDL35280.1 hypothetical protein E2R51_06065 [Jeotgalibacillus sp. S-D1]
MRNRMFWGSFFLVFFAFSIIAVKFNLTEMYRGYHSAAFFPAEWNAELPLHKEQLDSIRNDFEQAAIIFLCISLILISQRLPIWYFYRLFIFLAPAHYQSTFVRSFLQMMQMNHHEGGESLCFG